MNAEGIAGDRHRHHAALHVHAEGIAGDHYRHHAALLHVHAERVAGNRYRHYQPLFIEKLLRTPTPKHERYSW